MYNRLYKYILQYNVFYEKQFGFQASNSTEHPLIQLITQILYAFNENKYTLGILLKKLDMYGIKGKNLKWFHCYLTNRKQFIKCPDQNTDLEVLRCGVPQGSIGPGPLLFLVFVNDLNNSTKLLDAIMFADDTNFFYTNKSIKVLFETVNKELHYVNKWF